MAAHAKLRAHNNDARSGWDHLRTLPAGATHMHPSGQGRARPAVARSSHQIICRRKNNPTSPSRQHNNPSALPPALDARGCRTPRRRTRQDSQTRVSAWRANKDRRVIGHLPASGHNIPSSSSRVGHGDIEESHGRGRRPCPRNGSRSRCSRPSYLHCIA